MARFEFQYMSDLHLELFPGFRISRVTAPNLVLAGDIGDVRSGEYAGFVRDCVAKYERVFAVLGNHEAYGHGQTWDEAVGAAREVLAGLGATLLCRDRCDVGGGVRVIGATLWSDVHPAHAATVRTFLADFRCIRAFSLGDYRRMHREDAAWICAELARAAADGARVVVVTHHAPSLDGTSHPRHAGGALESAYASGLDDLLRPPVAAWVHGHTHFSGRQARAGGTAVLLSNQRGYGREQGDTGFDEGARHAV